MPHHTSTEALPNADIDVLPVVGSGIPRAITGFNEDDDFSDDGTPALLQTPQYSPGPIRDIARFKMIPADTKSNLRPKQGLGRAQLRSRPVSEARDVVTPSTRTPSRLGSSAEPASVTPRA